MLTLSLLCFNSGLYLGRFRIYKLLPERLQSFLGKDGHTGSTSLYSRIPAYDWSRSRLAGLNSTLFDIEANMRDGDNRAGLEGGGAQEIERIMNSQGVVSTMMCKVLEKIFT